MTAGVLRERNLRAGQERPRVLGLTAEKSEGREKLAAVSWRERKTEQRRVEKGFRGDGSERKKRMSGGCG